MYVNSLIGTVFSGLSALVVEDVTDDGDKVVVTAHTRDVAVRCPVCWAPAARVHGYHRRTVRDVPVDGNRADLSVADTTPPGRPLSRACPHPSVTPPRRRRAPGADPGVTESHSLRILVRTVQVTASPRSTDCGS